MSPPQTHPIKSPPPHSLLNSLGLWLLEVCVCVYSLHFLLALYGYFGAVVRLTLYTLPSIVKDRST